MFSINGNTYNADKKYIAIPFDHLIANNTFFFCETGIVFPSDAGNPCWDYLFK